MYYTDSTERIGKDPGFSLATEEISTSQNMAQGSNEQESNVEEVTSSMEEMGATISNDMLRIKSNNHHDHNMVHFT